MFTLLMILPSRWRHLLIKMFSSNGLVQRFSKKFSEGAHTKSWFQQFTILKLRLLQLSKKSILTFDPISQLLSLMLRYIFFSMYSLFSMPLLIVDSDLRAINWVHWRLPFLVKASFLKNFDESNLASSIIISKISRKNLYDDQCVLKSFWAFTKSSLKSELLKLKKEKVEWNRFDIFSSGVLWAIFSKMIVSKKWSGNQIIIRP